MALSEKMSVLQFIQPSHFDIAPVYRWHPAFTLARNEIAAINDVLSPQEKVERVFRTSKLIHHILGERGDGDGAGCADDFLPILIFVVLKAQPPFLNANVEYITRFRHPDRLSGERYYYLTQFASACEFLSNVGPSSLSIDPEEYTRLFCARRRRRNSDPGPTEGVGGVEGCRSDNHCPHRDWTQHYPIGMLDVKRDPNAKKEQVPAVRASR
mmetsp:Transcript_515/g.1278  ORF Transcript_515/g.1278 Transcript_515/m.1278 type:complete len:212 (+) Transcript_515:3-638(+)